MSIQLSDTTNYNGLVQFYEEAIGANPTDVSGSTIAFKKFCARLNRAIDSYHLIWAKSAGTWQADDANFTTYPILTKNIVSGTRDYLLDEDGTGNDITDISKVLILPSSTATQYIEITPVDELNTSTSEILLNTLTGVPTQYGKLSNALFLDRIPNYSVSAGIKIIVNREGSYFTTASDVTKKPGVPAYHEYFYLKPAYEYAQIKGLSNLKELEKAVIDLEGSERLGITGKIQEFFSRRERDVRNIMTTKRINYI